VSYSTSASLRSKPLGTVSLWTEVLTKYGADRPSSIVECYFNNASIVGLNPDLCLAQAAHETGWFRSRRWLEQRNPAGLGITSATVAGVDFRTIESGIQAHLAHVCCYVYTRDTCPVEQLHLPWQDPRHTFHDGFESVGDLIRPERRWAYPGTHYIDAVLRIVNSVLGIAISRLGELRFVAEIDRPYYTGPVTFYELGVVGPDADRTRILTRGLMDDVITYLETNSVLRRRPED
jgi:hypothetical protein